MGLLEEFQAQKRNTNGPRCNMAKLFDSLDAQTVAEVEAILALDAPHTEVARFISAKWPSFKVKDGTVSRHRRGECSC